MSNVPSSPVSDHGENASEEQSLASTPTPVSHLHRSLSYGAQQPSSSTSQSWSSATETPTPSQGQHQQATSYFGSSTSPASARHPQPILVRSSSAHSIRRGMRSTSASSRFREDEAFSEAEEYGEQEPRGGKAVSVDDNQVAHDDSDEQPSEEEAGNGKGRDDEDPITLKERQSLINVEHPFGLPIWKPALYKKSRSVTRYADEALHSVPSAQAERHLLPGNLFWVVVFGWWLSLVCFVISALLYVVPQGGKRYSTLVFGLGWYLAWPFGKYVEGLADDIDKPEEEEEDDDHERLSSESNHTVREGDYAHFQSSSWVPPSEHTPLIPATPGPLPAKSYGAAHRSATSSSSSIGLAKQTSSSDVLGRVCFWIGFACIIAPLMLIVCLICWFLVLTIPMAKLSWALIKHMFEQPETIRFCAAPLSVVVDSPVPVSEHVPQQASESSESSGAPTPTASRLSIKHTRLTKGQPAPSGSPCTAVLLCTYRAAGLKYYKYTVGGVNIMFVNLLFIVFFAIFDWAVFLTWVEELESEKKPVPALLAAIANQGTIFILSLLSVIPLSYFIGMAVASISAQSSIGMGAVINATFGSIIEILLYCIALDSGKGRLVEGSIVGSLLAGVLLMPGMSMVSSAMRRKEVRFNAKSAGVTSMMLIMAIIGAVAPTLFYQIYGNFQLICTGCPSKPPSSPNKPWVCDRCYYQHPDPVKDPFYQSTVKDLMFFCAAILIFSYLVGLWFSLRTHASQIWQNPQQLLTSSDLPVHSNLPQSTPNARQSLYHKLVPAGMQRTISHRASNLSTSTSGGGGRPQSPVVPFTPGGTGIAGNNAQKGPSSPTMQRRVSYAPTSIAIPPSPGVGGHGVLPTPVLESVDQAVNAVKGAGELGGGGGSLQIPGTISTDEFTRAVAVATVSALRHQQQAHAGIGGVQSPMRAKHSTAVQIVGGDGAGGQGAHGGAGGGGGHGGHDAPSWSRFTSASVLLACTALYAIIAEILVDVIDVILGDSGLDEKFLGVTLLALVPNTTEFMNAISFALNGNIALSMEIGSAYALQVCLLQIPVMVAFSAWWFPDRMGEVAHTFSLIFPRWDVIAIILSMFLLTYTYIEAKSNYHRGSILIMSYLVLIAGFYFAPRTEEIHPDVDTTLPIGNTGEGFAGASAWQEFNGLTIWEYLRWYLASWL
ncbi:hypothetical protein GYMLUDRAFT_74516 [Collybiopsis luxurians FD-317 M1]|uniref:Calcium/proton exchanger n=1 Tax=Collybiopsis luxurians FD-317 M1 TaxID=944289 RepID=A0A0D0B6Z2_9AGAR|nr:hypothetical protein GYMLUDRAFT_74516 [Collybiopsis luxurians FD-317 M1]